MGKSGESPAQSRYCNWPIGSGVRKPALRVYRIPSVERGRSLVARPKALLATHAGPWVGSRHMGRTIVILGGLILVLLLVSIVSIGLGAVSIPPAAILGMALQWLPVHPARTWSDSDLAIITQLRMPRIWTAMMVGSALAAA